MFYLFVEISPISFAASLYFGIFHPFFKIISGEVLSSWFGFCMSYIPYLINVRSCWALVISTTCREVTAGGSDADLIILKRGADWK